MTMSFTGVNDIISYLRRIFRNTQMEVLNLVLVYLQNLSKHSNKCTFYTLRFGCSFAAVNTIKPQLL